MTLNASYLKGCSKGDSLRSTGQKGNCLITNRSWKDGTGICAHCAKRYRDIFLNQILSDPQETDRRLPKI